MRKGQITGPGGTHRLGEEWLANLHNPAALEKILASDFVHPLPTGDFVTKAQHIQFASTHLPPPDRKRRFEQIQVRVYGDVGIADGIVLTTDEQGRELERTVFADVFVRRNWALGSGQRAGECG